MRRDQSEKYKISVIIVNYNSSHYTLACIQSIQEFTDHKLSYNIVVVDNNSETGDFHRLVQVCDPYANVRVVGSKINLGFSGGNMLGVQFANADYIFFLNNDTVILNDCLSILYKFMIGNQEAGICTGQMYNTDNSFHHSFSYFPTLSLKLFGSSLLRLFAPQKYPSRKKVYIDPLQVDFVTGAAMFVDYSKFSQIGGFDTNYFLYCEEEDIAMKLKLAGYSAFLTPEAKFIHHMGKSTKRNLEIEKENYISLLYYHSKYSSLAGFLLLKVIYFFKMLKKFYKHTDYIRLAFFILHGANLNNSMRHKKKIRLHDTQNA
jgi:GT2 family glycosyltransferase